MILLEVVAAGHPLLDVLKAPLNGRRIGLVVRLGSARRGAGLGGSLSFTPWLIQRGLGSSSHGAESKGLHHRGIDFNALSSRVTPRIQGSASGVGRPDLIVGIDQRSHGCVKRRVDVSGRETQRKLASGNSPQSQRSSVLNENGPHHTPEHRSGDEAPRFILRSGGVDHASQG